MKFFSPGKVNLFLRVLRRREDGYHELASLFQTLSLGDWLEFTLADEDALSCTCPGVPLDGSNLIIKAADLFRKKTGFRFSIHVHLEKKIPIQSGLGGGSSNAATTLWALNALHGYPCSQNDLMMWSQEIGSDVAFFFSQGTAYCTGRGEQIQNCPPVQLFEKAWVVAPKKGLSTPEVYKHFDPRISSSEDPKILLENALSGKLFLMNDLETPAFYLAPELKKTKEMLYKKGFAQVCLTGSGSAFFCLGESISFFEEAIPISFLNRKEHSWYDCPNRSIE